MNDRSTSETLIALGANEPNGPDAPRCTLDKALAALNAHPGIAVKAVAPWVRSPAFPPGSGPDFVNGAARLETDLTPNALLEALHRIEAQHGRTRRIRWEPRVCDLDLIAMGDLILPDASTQAAWARLRPDDAVTAIPERLILPHPRIAERAFVLLPLLDIAPDWRHPVTGLSVREMVTLLPRACRDEVVPLRCA
ncbi:MAG: 2-amino-4-hydroxy-6-hydroxymethyldihydropteridine diphosphokinase [Pikeienuella sp.]